MPKEPSASAKELEQRLRTMEQRLRQAEQRILSLEGTRAPPPAVPEFRVLPDEPEPQLRAMTPASRPYGEPSHGGPAPKADLERVLGGRWLAKAGMAVLVIGVVFFISYAFDKGWITRQMRIVLGVVGGLALAVVGELLRRWDAKRFWVYAQILVGGGAAIMYFALFAAYAFPDYRALLHMTLEVDSVALGIVAPGLGLYAVLAKTPVLAFEGLSMGILASLFGDHWAAFSVTYTVLLAIAALGAAAYRRWPFVAVVGGLACYVDLGILQANHVGPWPVLWGAFALLAVLTVAAFRLRLDDPTWRGADGALAGLAFLATWGLVEWSLDFVGKGLVHAEGPVTAAFALVALALAFVSAAAQDARWGWGIAGTIMLLSWPPIQFDGMAVALAWGALAALGAGILFVQNRFAVRAAVVAAGALILFHLALWEMPQVTQGKMGKGEAVWPFLLGTLAMLAAWVAARRVEHEEPTTRALLALGATPPLLYASIALDGFAIAIAWTLEAIALVVVGFALDIRDLRLGALAMFALVLGRVFLVDMVALDVAVRIITFLVVGGLLLVASFLFARRQRPTAVAP